MYNYITSVNQFGQFISDIQETINIGLDIETTGLDHLVDKITLLAIKLDDGNYLFDIQQMGEGILNYLVELIEGQNKLVIGQNLKFDLKFLYHKTGVMINKVYDTMVAENLINKGTGKNYYSLKELVEKYCNEILDKEVRDSFINQTEEMSIEQLVYAEKDVEYLFEIRRQQMDKIAEQKQIKVLDLENSILPVFTLMEYEGIRLDKEKWLALAEKAKGIAVEKEQALKDFIIKTIKLSKFNNALELLEACGVPVTTKRDKNKYSALGKETYPEIIRQHVIFTSPKQTVSVLKLCGLDVESSSEKNLVDHKDKEVVKLLFEYREQIKKATSFGEEFLKHINSITGKIHCNLDQLATDTGRVAASKPNLLQIPGDPEYRQSFIPEEGYKLIDLDYSGQELRLAANIFNEPKLVKAFKEDQDIHALSGSLIYDKKIEDVTKEERKRGKVLNFASLYGVSAWGLHKNFGFSDEESKTTLKKFWAGYPGMKKSVDEIGNAIIKYGYSVSVLGRKRFFNCSKEYFDETVFKYGVEQLDKEIAAYKREGVNMVIQSSAADTTKIAVKKIYYENPFGKDLKILLTIHDEILCMAKEEIANEAKEFVEKCMLEAEQQFLGEVPAKVEGGVYDYWGH